MTKKRAKAKQEPEETPQSELDQLLEGDPVSEEEEKQAAKAEAEAEPKPEDEPEPEPDEPSEEEKQRLAEEQRVAAEEREKREKGLRDEISRLRQEVRSLNSQNQALQMPPQMPQQSTYVPHPMQGYPQPQDQTFYPQQTPGVPMAPGGQPHLGGPSQFRVPVSFDGDSPAVDIGPAVMDYVDRRMQQMEQMSRPNPQQLEAEAINRARGEWISANPEESAARTQAANRVQQAAELLDYKVGEYVMRTGHRPSGFEGLVSMIEQSEIGETMRQYFPEIQDMASFVDAVGMPVSDPSVRTWKLRNYMDRYMEGQRSTQPQPGNGGERTPPQQASNVVPIPNKPRSMAVKGQGAAAASTDKQQFEHLSERIGKEVFVPEEDFAEYQRLGKKLGLEGF